MSNVNNPHGLLPVMRTLAGGAPEMNGYTKAAAYGQAIFYGDPVTQLAGVLNGPASGITPGTTLLLGVAADYSPASTLKDPFLVFDSNQQIFEAQEDNSGAANLVAAKMGYNANLTGTAGGGILSNRSEVQVSGTSINTTATLDVRILRLVPDPANAYGAYGRVELFINKHLRNFGITAT